MKTPPYIWFQRVSNIPVYDREVEPLGIIMPTAPAPGFSVLGMRRIPNHTQKLLISRNATDILRWPGTSAVDAGCVIGNGIKEEHLLNFNRMAPVVAKVIEVEEFPASAAEIAKTNPAFIEDLRIAIG